MKVFILEDDPARMLYLRERLFGHDITHIESCTQADRFQPPYDLILLDHDLGGRQMAVRWKVPLTLSKSEDCGETFVRLVRDRINMTAVVIIHSYNPEGAGRMWKLLCEQGLTEVCTAPFRGDWFECVLDLMLREKAAA